MKFPFGLKIVLGLFLFQGLAFASTVSSTEQAGQLKKYPEQDVARFAKAISAIQEHVAAFQQGMKKLGLESAALFKLAEGMNLLAKAT